MISAFSAGASHAAVYYVATNGADSSPGDLARPWATIQKAADTLAPGDTAFVRGGTYAKVTVNVSGTAAGGYVTFQNYPGETPVIDGTGVTPPGGDTALFLISGRQYVSINGFELRNYATADINKTPAGVFLAGACRHIRIHGCNIHDIANTGGDPSNSGNAFGIAVYGRSVTPAMDIVIDGNEVHHLRTGSSESMTLNGNVTNFWVTGNKVHDNNNIGIDFIGWEGTCPDPAQDQARDGVCSGNTVWNITSQGNQAYPTNAYGTDGLYCDGGARVIFERNVVHDCDVGLEVGSEHANRSSSGVVVRDNFIYNNRRYGFALGGYDNSVGGCDNCTVTGNTFFKDDMLLLGYSEAAIKYHTTNCALRNNIFVGSANNWLFKVTGTAADNVNNLLDYNLYFAPAGQASALWSWNNIQQKGFSKWKTAGGQDAHSLFADPKFVSTAAPPDLHLANNSPAVDAGDPAFAPATDEGDVDGRSRITGTRVDIGADELNPMDAWRLAMFGASATNAVLTAATADPDGDGVLNLAEYAFGGNPLVADPGVAPVGSLMGGRLAITFNRRVANTDLTMIVQGTDNLLGVWSNLASSCNGAPMTAALPWVGVSESGSGSTRTVQVTDLYSASDPAHPQRALRVLLSQ
jgi:Right handed beta helix region